MEFAALSSSRFTLDVAAIPVMQRLLHLPILAKPSHRTGKWYPATPVALAAVAAGAQSTTFDNFDLLMAQVGALNGVREAPVPA